MVQKRGRRQVQAGRPPALFLRHISAGAQPNRNLPGGLAARLCFPMSRRRSSARWVHQVMLIHACWVTGPRLAMILDPLC